MAFDCSSGARNAISVATCQRWPRTVFTLSAGFKGSSLPRSLSGASCVCNQPHPNPTKSQSSFLPTSQPHHLSHRFGSCRSHGPCSWPEHHQHSQQQPQRHRLPQHLPPASSSSSSSPACSCSHLSSRPPSSSSSSSSCSSVRYRLEQSGSPGRHLSCSRPDRYTKSPLC